MQSIYWRTGEKIPLGGVFNISNENNKQSFILLSVIRLVRYAAMKIDCAQNRDRKAVIFPRVGPQRTKVEKHKK